MELPKSITEHLFNWPCRKCYGPQFYRLIGSDIGTTRSCLECGHDNVLDSDIVAKVDQAFIAAVRDAVPALAWMSDEALLQLRRKGEPE